MEHLKTIRSNLSDLESAARDLTRYKPRQWADIVMCRMIAIDLLKYFAAKFPHENGSVSFVELIRILKLN